jgi:phosphatidylserine/phosphatidylglycerophosphate/cardiolipin synthase-like enzyme
MAAARVKAYPSPGCVLLAFDWADGERHPDFIGFAIQRDPGYSRGGAPQFLFNKLDFVPLAKDAKPKPSNKAPIQKFNWWDGGIDTSDRGKTFEYTVIPVRGTGPDDLSLQTDAAGVVRVKVPEVLENGIATYFNRAVVSAQSFLKFSEADLKKKMRWLANGIQEAVPAILDRGRAFECAIYHLSDQLWILPALERFSGRGSIIYFDKSNDTKSRAAINVLRKEKHNISYHKRDAITKLMHDKFIVAHGTAVLMGSMNFTPEAQTIQANLLHIFNSSQLAGLYAKRAEQLAANLPTKEIAKFAGWHKVEDVPGSGIRVFFLPESGTGRVFLDTVTAAVKHAKSSVLFCMFTASDKALIEAIFAQGDSKDHLIYGLLNSIDDPEKPTKKGEKRKLPEIAATIFHRSKEKRDTLPYAAFGLSAPRGFLPELRTVNTAQYDISAKARGTGKSRQPPPVHVHHKFIVIDGDTDNPTIYSGSPNFSKASENSNDENVLEIRGNVPLAHCYVAEFMRLYNHYRARAIWNETHKPGSARKARSGSPDDPLILKRTRDEWVKGAFRAGTKEFLARTRGL